VIRAIVDRWEESGRWSGSFFMPPGAPRSAMVLRTRSRYVHRCRLWMPMSLMAVPGRRLVKPM